MTGFDILFACFVLIRLLDPLVHTVSAQECITPDNQEGTCLHFRRCQPLQEIQQTQDHAAADFFRQSLCPSNDNDQIYCCPNNPNKQKRGLLISIETKYKYRALRPPYCGFSNATHTRVVGGKPAKLGAWPWIVALGFHNYTHPWKDPQWHCGGSLISARHVLTAAHCAILNSLYVVRIGDLNLKRDDDGAHPIQIEVDSKLIHPDYSSESNNNDIAILKLKEDVPFSEYIYPICLPIEKSLRNKNFVGYNPFIAGWGALRFDEPYTNALMELQLPVVTNAVCEKAYEEFDVTITNKEICAGGDPRGGKDACGADSGGPLMIPQQFTYYQIGVLSSGHNCGTVRFPAVYTRVTSYFDDFILPVLQNY